MVGIYKGSAEISNFTIGSTAVSGVYVGSTQVRPSGQVTESIVYKMNADSDGNLYVPVGGYSHSNTANCAYNWNVSVDEGTATNYSGTGSKGGSITLSGYTAGSSHTIMITPTTEVYGWALAYGRYNTVGRAYLTKVVYDGSYMGYGESATSTGDYFRNSQYCGCTSLTSAPKETLSNSVTTIGIYFRSYQYSGCTALTTAPSEVLPDTVTTIGVRFRIFQYSGCTALTTAATEALPNSVTSIGYRFRDDQYKGCTSLTSAPAEVLSSSITSIPTYFRSNQYYGCTSLTASATEALPSSVTSIGTYFKLAQYYGCTALTTAATEVLPDSVTSIDSNFRAGQYNGCTALTTISGWKDLSIGSDRYRSKQFYNCTASKTVKVISDVGYTSYDSDTLQNSYVASVSVPSTYLSNFTGASVNPWSSIDDSKFVGY